MRKENGKSVNLIRKISFILLIVFSIVFAGYGLTMFFTGFGGYLSFIWFVPGALCVLFAAMIKGKIVLRKWQKRMMIYVLIPIVVFFLVVEGIIFSGFFQRPKEEPAYIVVLGTTVYDHGPCYLLRQRLKEAKEWADVYPDSKIVVTGGQGKNEPFTEGSEMKRYLIEELGVDADRIIVEEASMNTFENMVLSGEILEREDENFSYEKTPILLVTNNFHMYRAMQIAEKAGFENVSGAPSGTYPYLFPHYMVREFCAIIKNVALGRM